MTNVCEKRVKISPKVGTTIFLMMLFLAFSSISAFAAPSLITTTFPTEDIVIADYIVSADTTGVTDATSAIQTQINACSAAGGGTVWLPAGTYKVSSRIDIPNFVTLRGDWRDPDSGSGSYGTVINAVVTSGITSDSSRSVFRIGGCAGINGLTIFYPNQSINSPVAYDYTIVIPANAWYTGNEYYRNMDCSSVVNCTLINSYRGVGVSVVPNARDGYYEGQAHGLEYISNLKGTILSEGLTMTNGSEISNILDVTFKPDYWANYNGTSLTAIQNYTRANATAYIFGDTEQDNVLNFNASYVNVGINATDRWVPMRYQGSIKFTGVQITNANIALKRDYNCDLVFSRSTLSGSSKAIEANANGNMSFADCTISGAITGDTSAIEYDNRGYSSSITQRKAPPKVTRSVLYTPTVPHTSSVGSTLPTTDATSAIQSALTTAGNAGGGVVYLPAGWYKVSTHLSVPANVELRGASASVNKELYPSSAGTVLFAYEKKNSSTADTDTAFITLNGSNSGVNGLRIFYPENTIKNVGLAKYPYAVRGNGSSEYVMNFAIINGWNGIDFQTNACNDHFVKNYMACAFKNQLKVGGQNGWIETVASNISFCFRTYLGSLISGYLEGDANGLPGDEHDILMTNGTMAIQDYAILTSASSETMINMFAYGAKNGYKITGSNVNAKNINVGMDQFVTLFQNTATGSRISFQSAELMCGQGEFGTGGQTTSISGALLFDGPYNMSQIMGTNTDTDFIGSNSEGGITDECGTDLSMAKYTASRSGNATNIQINIADNVASGKKVKAAIYSDNSGSPGSFLMGTNELTAPTAGWHELTLTAAQSITSGTAYWLVVWSDDPNFHMKADSDSGNGRYKSTTYSLTWPAATGMSTNNVKYCMYATDTGTTPTQLIGSNSSGSTYDGVGSDLSMAKFTASANGTATKIKVKLNNACTAGKKVKVAIYADNAGAPGAMLMGSNELTAPAAGWQEFTLTSSQSITSGTTYWLAVWSDDTNHLEISCDTQTGISRYKTLTYGTWPNNPTGMINGDNKYCIYAY